MRFTLSVLLTFAILCTSAPAQTAKKRIAIMDFDYGAVQNSVSAIFGTREDVGKGITDLLIDRLVTDGRYSVIERKQLDKIIAEQNFSNSNRADPDSAAKLAKILGVDAIIIGSITQFGRDDKNTSVGGSAVGGLASRYGLGGVGRKSSKAVVAINARMIDTNTAEILAVASGKGESKRSGTTLLGSGGSWGNSGSGGLDMSSSNFGETILGEAVSQAVTQVAEHLDENEAKLPTRALAPVTGLIADVSGKVLILNVGSKAGVKTGDHLAVRRVGRTITDPSTGKVLRRIEQEIGSVTITDVDEQSSVGNYSGADTPKVGDAVKSAQ